MAPLTNVRSCSPFADRPSVRRSANQPLSTLSFIFSSIRRVYWPQVPCGWFLVREILLRILSERESISHTMQTILDEATDPWGVKVERVEM